MTVKFVGFILFILLLAGSAFQVWSLIQNPQLIQFVWTFITIGCTAITGVNTMRVE